MRTLYEIRDPGHVRSCLYRSRSTNKEREREEINDVNDDKLSVL